MPKRRRRSSEPPKPLDTPQSPDNPFAGYKLLPGSARRYVSPTGETISRYEYDSRRLRAAGWKNRGEFERARKSESWEGVKKWHDKMTSGEPYRSAMAIGVDPRIRNAFDVETRRRALPRDILGNTDDRDDPALIAADGPLAQLLVDMGYRDPADQWPVGDTPKGEKIAA